MYVEMERPDQATTSRAPVVLVHGLFVGPFCFTFLSRYLRQQGFRVVEVFRYRAPGHGVVRIAELLGRYVDHLASSMGASHVHLVGHSLGGLVARVYTQLGGGAPNVLTYVTLGAPNNGVPLAHLGVGRIARELRPGSELLRRLSTAPSAKTVRFTSVYGRRDRIVAPDSAVRCNGHARDIENVVLDGIGHVGLLFSSNVASAMATELLTAERAHRSSESAV